MAVSRHLGLDPGLICTGWGIIDVDGNRISHVANGEIAPPPKQDDALRLRSIYQGLGEVLASHRPDQAGVEAIFVSRNPGSALKLGMARGVAMLAVAAAGIPLSEYAARLVKKAVVGNGNAEKSQVQAMVRRLLPGVEIAGDDAADALAIAICHAHHATTRAWAAAS
ncbi:MAG: crossover junction endodeoxyribonuclease RuvC [Alphaproteobacteria bacterium]|nr:crossover junction endodeoxyribonuclease RuvC [Alphaproteobacteria bacterium]